MGTVYKSDPKIYWETPKLFGYPKKTYLNDFWQFRLWARVELPRNTEDPKDYEKVYAFWYRL